MRPRGAKHFVFIEQVPTIRSMPESDLYMPTLFNYLSSLFGIPSTQKQKEKHVYIYIYILRYYILL